MPSAATARAVSSSPSSSPMAINSERSSTYFPAHGFSITATAAAFRVGGEISRSISRCVSSTYTAILRIFAFIPSSSWVSFSSQPVFTFDLRYFEAADAGMHAGAGGHHQREQNFVRARGIIDPNFHRVEMTAHVRGVDVGDGHVEPRAQTADFFCGRHDRLRATENFAHRISARHMPQSSMLDLSCRSDDRALAI